MARTRTIVKLSKKTKVTSKNITGMETFEMSSSNGGLPVVNTARVQSTQDDYNILGMEDIKTERNSLSPHTRNMLRSKTTNALHGLGG